MRQWEKPMRALQCLDTVLKVRAYKPSIGQNKIRFFFNKNNY